MNAVNVTLGIDDKNCTYSVTSQSETVTIQSLPSPVLVPEDVEVSGKYLLVLTTGISR